MPVDERRPPVVGPSDLDEVEDAQVLHRPDADQPQGVVGVEENPTALLPKNPGAAENQHPRNGFVATEKEVHQAHVDDDAVQRLEGLAPDGVGQEGEEDDEVADHANEGREVDENGHKEHEVEGHDGPIWLGLHALPSRPFSSFGSRVGESLDTSLFFFSVHLSKERFFFPPPFSSRDQPLLEALPVHRTFAELLAATITPLFV